MVRPRHVMVSVVPKDVVEVRKDADPMVRRRRAMVTAARKAVVPKNACRKAVDRWVKDGCLVRRVSRRTSPALTRTKTVASAVRSWNVCSISSPNWIAMGMASSICRN